MSHLERILLNQIAMMRALQLCLRQGPPLNEDERSAIAALEGLIALSQSRLDGESEEVTT